MAIGLSDKLEKCSSIEEFRKLVEEEQDNEDYYIDDFFEAACRVGDMEFIEENIDEIELNGLDGYCEYLYATDNEEVINYLLDHGAFKSQDEYYDYRFSYETFNGYVLAFDEYFRHEVLEKYLEKYNLTKEKLISILESKEDKEIAERSIIYDMSILKIRAENGEIIFDNIFNLQCGGSIHEILEELDYELQFEGDSWKLETIGYYFIE